MDWKPYPSVTLPSDVIERCRRHGEQMSEDLQHPENIRNARSATVSSHDAEKDPILLGRSKMAECAFCQWAGISIEELHWKRVPDDGWDVIWKAIRIDVKHTAHLDARYCIWPINKTTFFDSKQFDVIVQVFGTEPTFWVQGWISKREFRRLRKIAKGIRGVTDGTRYVDTEHLEPIETLENPTSKLAGFVGYDAEGRFIHYCHCGAWGSFGTGCFLRRGQLGIWFCREHRPVTNG